MIGRTIAHLPPGRTRLALRRSRRRLIGGETLEEACAIAARLNVEGRRVSLGLLGEDVSNEKESRRTAAEERRTLEEIEARKLDATLSVKLSALGLFVDDDLCLELLTALATAASEKGSAVLIDMESSAAVDAALRLYRRLREQGHDDVSLALQARLRRTLDDIKSLGDLEPRLSICKGAYGTGNGADSVAEPGKVREQFLRAVSRAADCASQVGVSTHDRGLIDESLRLLSVAGRARSDYEIQTLLAVAPKLEEELVGAGETVRVYVPFGEDWYPYVMRRMSK